MTETVFREEQLAPFTSPGFMLLVRHGTATSRDFFSKKIKPSLPRTWGSEDGTKVDIEDFLRDCGLWWQCEQVWMVQLKSDCQKFLQSRQARSSSHMPQHNCSRPWGRLTSGRIPPNTTAAGHEGGWHQGEYLPTQLQQAMRVDDTRENTSQHNCNRPWGWMTSGRIPPNTTAAGHEGGWH